MRTKPSGWDLLAVIAVVVCAALLFVLPLLQEETGRTLVVTTPSGQSEYALDADRELAITSNGYTLVIVIHNGTAWVRESDCADHVCVASGTVSRSGETIVCAPSGVSVTVKGGDDDVDFVAG